jgi:hypothetical protein
MHYNFRKKFTLPHGTVSYPKNSYFMPLIDWFLVSCDNAFSTTQAIYPQSSLSNNTQSVSGCLLYLSVD